MDNSQMVFCKVEDIEKMNKEEEEVEEECEMCLGTGFVKIEEDEFECEYCDIIQEHYSSDSDSDYKPDWDEDHDTDEDSYSEESDCGTTCNDNVCLCGSI